MKNVILKNFEVRKVGEEYRARVTYQYEDEKGIWELVADNVVLPVNQDCFSLTQHYDGYEVIDFGLRPCRIEPCDEGWCIKTTLIKEKIHDMTIEEIEKKLGYRVRIVKGEEKKG